MIDAEFNDVVKLFKRDLPKGETLPNSFYKMKSIINKLRLGCERIDSFPNDCLLF